MEGGRAQGPKEAHKRVRSTQSLNASRPRLYAKPENIKGALLYTKACGGGCTDCEGGKPEAAAN
eukprot:1158890-Pelagomonas_calceolata.AAC.4